MTDNLYWVWLTVTMKFAAVSISRVLYKFTPREAYNATTEELICAGIDNRSAEKLSDKSLDRAKSIIEKCAKKNISIITSLSEDYPRALDRLDDKPHVLYVRGDVGCIRGRRTACFIGTRNVTAEGMRHSTEYAHRLISEGNVLISGIADGIDTVAATVSLEENNPTVAVMGVDIDKYYPTRNERLIDRIAETGAVISEYPPDTGARFFPDRNRIIVGLSDTVSVLEASEKSGALIGARLALKKKIPTYALALDGDSFKGCRLLIEEGAKPLNINGKTAESKSSARVRRSKESSASVTEPKEKKRAEKKSPAEDKPMPEIRSMPESLKELYALMYEALKQGECSIKDFNALGYASRYVSSVISLMEIYDIVQLLPGERYKLK